MSTLILLRHGRSDWNEKNLFTGWVDVDLTDQGRAEAKRAGELIRDAGLTRVNISLDTLRPDRFLQMARRDRFADTLTGIQAADDAGFHPLKLNTVLLRGVNDDEAVDLEAGDGGVGEHVDVGHARVREALGDDAGADVLVRHRLPRLAQDGQDCFTPTHGHLLLLVGAAGGSS